MARGRRGFGGRRGYGGRRYGYGRYGRRYGGYRGGGTPMKPEQAMILIVVMVIVLPLIIFLPIGVIYGGGGGIALFGGGLSMLLASNTKRNEKITDYNEATEQWRDFEGNYFQTKLTAMKLESYTTCCMYIPKADLTANTVDYGYHSPTSLSSPFDYTVKVAWWYPYFYTTSWEVNTLEFPWSQFYDETFRVVVTHDGVDQTTMGFDLYYYEKEGPYDCNCNKWDICDSCYSWSRLEKICVTIVTDNMQSAYSLGGCYDDPDSSGSIAYKRVVHYEGVEDITPNDKWTITFEVRSFHDPEVRAEVITRGSGSLGVVETGNMVGGWIMTLIPVGAVVCICICCCGCILICTVVIIAVSKKKSLKKFGKKVKRVEALESITADKPVFNKNTAPVTFKKTAPSDQLQPPAFNQNNVPVVDGYKSPFSNTFNVNVNNNSNVTAPNSPLNQQMNDIQLQQTNQNAKFSAPTYTPPQF